MPRIDLSANPDEPRAKASERVGAACDELRRLREQGGWIDERGFWFPYDPAACVELAWTREGESR